MWKYVLTYWINIQNCSRLQLVLFCGQKGAITDFKCKQAHAPIIKREIKCRVEPWKVSVIPNVSLIGCLRHCMSINSSIADIHHLYTPMDGPGSWARTVDQSAELGQTWFVFVVLLNVTSSVCLSVKQEHTTLGWNGKEINKSTVWSEGVIKKHNKPSPWGLI